MWHYSALPDPELYEETIKKSWKKFAVADRDRDEQLNKKEFGDFMFPGIYIWHSSFNLTVVMLHCHVPEEAENMREVVLDDEMEEIDTNKDGFVSLEEFTSKKYTFSLVFPG